MGQINNYPVESVNATDRILTSDGVTGVTKNVTPEGLSTYINSSIYKVYTALLTQTSTNTPIVEVLENTLGVTLTVAPYSAEGFFFLNAPSNIFTSKTAVLIGNTNSGVIDVPIISADVNSLSQIMITTINGATTNTINGLLLNTCIEIRVYN